MNVDFSHSSSLSISLGVQVGDMLVRHAVDPSREMCSDLDEPYNGGLVSWDTLCSHT